ncbi:MAG: DNA gyrase inhibitor YacG [Planctomycetota bacterium]
MEKIHCPTCGTKFDAAHTVAMPFCSDRCRQIDLGRWFNEEYSVPATRDDWDEEDDTEDDAHNEYSKRF